MIADRYKVEREIGRGGMATVYLCTDNQGGENVAVKLLRPELGSAVVKERFLREISFASELDHPQIPKVLGSGILDGVPFYVMTYIDGESLRARLDREKQLPIDEAIRIAQAIARPTAYAHSRGIIHRDIKPANVLLSNDSVYVLDFGVARAHGIYGPWQRAKQNPILKSDKRWKCPGHGAVLQSPNGHWWLLYNGYRANGPPPRSRSTARWSSE